MSPISMQSKKSTGRAVYGVAQIVLLHKRSSRFNIARKGIIDVDPGRQAMQDSVPAGALSRGGSEMQVQAIRRSSSIANILQRWGGSYDILQITFPPSSETSNAPSAATAVPTIRP